MPGKGQIIWFSLGSTTFMIRPIYSVDSMESNSRCSVSFVRYGKYMIVMLLLVRPRRILCRVSS